MHETPHKRIVLTQVSEKPAGASVLQLSGGPFIAQTGADTDYICDRCGCILASVPGSIHFAGDRGPAIFVCYDCGTNNLAP